MNTTSTRTRPSSARTLKPAEIRQAITHTREHVVGTTEALAHDTRETVQAKAGQVKQRLQVRAETLRNKARKTLRQAGNLTDQARRRLPSPASGRIGQVTETVRQRPVPATAAVLGVVLVLLRQLRRRRRGDL